MGHNGSDVWKSAIEGKSGIESLDCIDPEKLPIKFGGEVKDFKISPNSKVITLDQKVDSLNQWVDNIGNQIQELST